MSRSETKQYMDQVRAMVEREGWIIQGVFPTVLDNPEDRFAYTVGLTAKGLPELYIACLSAEVSAALLNEIATEAIARGKVPTVWDVGDEEMERPYQMRAVPVTTTDEERPFGSAIGLYGQDNVTGVQFVWPSRDHAYPWDEAWPKSLYQPVLDAPKDALKLPLDMDPLEQAN